MKCAVVALAAITLVMGQACAVAESAQETSRDAVEELQRLRELLRQSPGPVKRNILDAVALTAWQVLFRVPHKGLREAQRDMEEVIAIRKTLEQHPALPENLLALRLQQALDAALLHEVIREHEHRTGVSFYRKHILEKAPEAFNIPFKDDSLSPEVLRTLLDANRLDEAQRVRYALGLDNRFAEAFKKAGASVSSILEGDFSYKGMHDTDLEQYYRHSASHFLPRERTREGLSDHVFVTTLKSIDQARFVRIVGGLYLENGKFPHTREKLEAAVTKRIERLPPGRRGEVLTGKAFDASDVTRSVLIQAGIPGHYYLPLSAFLHPFLRDLSGCPGFPSENSKKNANKIFAVGWCLEFAPE